jgi:hypothetical protein
MSDDKTLSLPSSSYLERESTKSRRVMPLQGTSSISFSLIGSAHAGLIAFCPAEKACAEPLSGPGLDWGFPTPFR